MQLYLIEEMHLNENRKQAGTFDKRSTKMKPKRKENNIEPPRCIFLSKVLKHCNAACNKFES